MGHKIEGANLIARAALDQKCAKGAAKSKGRTWPPGRPWAQSV